MDGWVLDLDLDLHLLSVLERSCCEESCFPAAFLAHDFSVRSLSDICLSEICFSTKFPVKKRRVLRLRVSKNALGFTKGSYWQLQLWKN